VTVAGIALGAGGGRRFGGAKALIRHRGELLVERCARLLAEGGASPVVVVVGAQADEVVAAARFGPDVTVVPNAAWAEGIGSSLGVGLDALTPLAGVEAAVVALVDQPQITAELVERLVVAWRGGARAAVATFDGAPRNPVVLDRALWPEVARGARGDVGARAFLRAHPDLVVPVAGDGYGSDLDIDTPADLAALGEAAEEGAPCN